MCFCNKSSSITGDCPKCKTGIYEEQAYKLYGWICPNCNSGNSPYVIRCSCAQNSQWDVWYVQRSI